LVEGKAVEAVEAAWEITPEDVVAYLETLPPENMHCAELAVGALYLALRNHREFKHEPWKKLYQKK
jgi:nitrogen fixation NifU-like protein